MYKHSMENVLLVLLLIVVVAMVAIILVQRTEGGALGIGGGQSQFLSVRGSANLLTRATAILATLFMGIALALAVLANQKATIDAGAAPTAPLPELAPEQTGAGENPPLPADLQSDPSSPTVPLSQ